MDIGTGNGAIAAIARATAIANDSHFEIHGVDRADIEPTRFVHTSSDLLAGIHFHSHTPVELLPFPNGYFDGVSGQYALEYTNMPTSVAELCRVAKPDARLRFVVHAEGAVPLSDADSSLREIEFLTRTLGLIEKARTLMRATFTFERAAAYDTALEDKARRARQDYLAAARQADAYYPRAKCKTMFSDLLSQVRKTWDHRHELTLDYILECIDSIHLEIRAHEARLVDMHKAALTRSKVEDLMECFRSSGCTKIELAELRPPEDPRFWGWELTMQAHQE